MTTEPDCIIKHNERIQKIRAIEKEMRDKLKRHGFKRYCKAEYSPILAREREIWVRGELESFLQRVVLSAFGIEAKTPRKRVVISRLTDRHTLEDFSLLINLLNEERNGKPAH